jgi:hypothetical protein
MTKTNCDLPLHPQRWPLPNCHGILRTPSGVRTTKAGNPTRRLTGPTRVTAQRDNTK